MPCRNQIFNDWEHDGQIASTYPLACYRDALRHMPTTEQIYTSLEDDIRAALQAAIARVHGKKVAAQIGHKFTDDDAPDGAGARSTAASDDGRAHTIREPPTPTTKRSPLAGVAAGAGGGGVPLPLLVLGGIALVLVGSGAVGIVVRGRRA